MTHQPAISILSRDAQQYAALLTQASSDLTLCQVLDTVPADFQCAQTEVLLCDPDLGAKAVRHMPSLRWVQSTWAGVAPLLCEPQPDWQLTGIKGIFGPQMREFVLTYLLYFVRRVEAFQTLQRQSLWAPLRPGILRGKTLGLAGVGDIGRSVAEAASGLGMKVHGLSLRSRDCSTVEQYFSPSEKVAFAASVDYLVGLLPATDATAHLIDADMLAALPPHGVVINAGRASTLDHSALRECLQRGHLAGAVLDVLPSEPLPDDDPLWRTPNCLITQHTAALSHPEEIARIFINNVQKYRDGQPLNYTVDWHNGY
ncbi:D-2-hydroxyacid dehydrogenase [Aestuariibacter halophilus]|uniref:D-2-hydroxyacid dehydrogenase n=1 Tax=Fluctibacter halophilus TaxID=226011 RepID=A0ABS8GAL6_9ALTE|nr:D-2-hydroxyacid dehydrogenase [Aestuariibacter halophilus]MCC2617448.1 D-2-hydroxyacid dehydrogenase [Aestuariibacter halophilus]